MFSNPLYVLDALADPVSEYVMPPAGTTNVVLNSASPSAPTCGLSSGAESENWERALPLELMRVRSASPPVSEALTDVVAEALPSALEAEAPAVSLKLVNSDSVSNSSKSFGSNPLVFASTWADVLETVIAAWEGGAARATNAIASPSARLAARLVIGPRPVPPRPRVAQPALDLSGGLAQRAQPHLAPGAHLLDGGRAVLLADGDDERLARR